MDTPPELQTLLTKAAVLPPEIGADSSELVAGIRLRRRRTEIQRYAVSVLIAVGLLGGVVVGLTRAGGSTEIAASGAMISRTSMEGTPLSVSLQGDRAIRIEVEDLVFLGSADSQPVEQYQILATVGTQSVAITGSTLTKVGDTRRLVVVVHADTPSKITLFDPSGVALDSSETTDSLAVLVSTGDDLSFDSKDFSVLSESETTGLVERFFFSPSVQWPFDCETNMAIAMTTTIQGPDVPEEIPSDPITNVISPPLPAPCPG